MKTIIQTPTNNIEESLNFYSKLKFGTLTHKNLILVTDGKAVIQINPDRFARAGVKFYSKDWKEAVDQLEKLTPVVKTEEGYLLSDPSGTWIYLVENEEITNAQINSIKPSVLGNFAGISLEVISIKKALEIWNLLGFSHSMGSADQGWVSLANEDGMAISLMKPLTCPHLFFNPSLTYFNGGNNLAVIENIRKLGIPITEEITHFNKDGIVDNIIIRDPGGFGFFVFND